MSLYIRDDSVDDLVVQLQKILKTSNKTEAVRLALKNEIERSASTVPLKDRIRLIQDKVELASGSQVRGA